MCDKSRENAAERRGGRREKMLDKEMLAGLLPAGRSAAKNLEKCSENAWKMPVEAFLGEISGRQTQKSNHIGQLLAEFGGFRAKVDRIPPNVAPFGPNLVKGSPSWVEFGIQRPEITASCLCEHSSSMFGAFFQVVSRVPFGAQRFGEDLPSIFSRRPPCCVFVASPACDGDDDDDGGAQEQEAELRRGNVGRVSPIDCRCL